MWTQTIPATAICAKVRTTEYPCNHTKRVLSPMPVALLIAGKLLSSMSRSFKYTKASWHDEVCLNHRLEWIRPKCRGGHLIEREANAQ